MTIQELYDWAKENGCLDKTIAKNCNLDIYDIEAAVYINDDYAGVSVDKVILD
jgi:hypothetical protein